MYEITPPCYAINTCILYRLCFKRFGFLKEHLIGYTQAKNIFTMLRHLIAEISRSKFHDYRGLRTGATDLKLFVCGVYMLTRRDQNRISAILQTTFPNAFPWTKLTVFGFRCHNWQYANIGPEMVGHRRANKSLFETEIKQFNGEFICPSLGLNVASTRPQCAI